MNILPRALLAGGLTLLLAACSDPFDTATDDSLKLAATASAEIVLREATALAAASGSPVDGGGIAAAITDSNGIAGEFQARWDGTTSTLVLTRQNLSCTVAVAFQDGSAQAGDVTCS